MGLCGGGGFAREKDVLPVVGAAAVRVVVALEIEEGFLREDLRADLRLREGGFRYLRVSLIFRVLVSMNSDYGEGDCGSSACLSGSRSLVICCRELDRVDCSFTSSQSKRGLYQESIRKSFIKPNTKKLA